MYERLIPQDLPMALAINLISGEELRKDVHLRDLLREPALLSLTL
jgi:hypothetical protein